jgi:hypothetical protein
LRRDALEQLPEHFVVKPALGNSSRGCHIISAGRSLLEDRSISAEELYAKIVAERGRGGLIPLLAEEFVPSANGDHVLPTEYKFYMFGEHVGLIQVAQATGDPAHPRAFRFYFPDWRACGDRINTTHPVCAEADPPTCLDEMISVARMLGRSLESFIRVDLFASPESCVFGEFSATPLRGRNYTPYGDRLLGELWATHCGSRS